MGISAIKSCKTHCFREFVSDILMMAGMLEEHRNILKRHRVDLVRDLEPSKVLNDLYECLDEDDREAVKAHSTRVARAEELVDMIPRRGPEAFQCFVAALYKRQRHLAMPLIEESGIDSSSFEKGKGILF